MARDVRNLDVFRESDRLLLDVMAIAATRDAFSSFTLRNQLTRAALSVPVNLVEGSQRSTTREYGRFVEIAAGSAAEARYLLSVAGRLAPTDLRLRQLERDYNTLVRRLHALRSRLASLPDVEGRATSPPAHRTLSEP
jgi:four helix bundle protein